MDFKIFAATKAFIVHEGKVLLLREAGKYEDGTNVGRYDVPGGRVEPGQRFDESLLREIKEETGLEVGVGRPFFVNEWRPLVRGEQWQIIGTFFECFAQNEKVVLSKDHDEYIWIDPKDFKQFNIIENLVPVFLSYLDLKK
jgi:8-oxo-dGTP diphosphatase